MDLAEADLARGMVEPAPIHGAVGDRAAGYGDKRLPRRCRLRCKAVRNWRRRGILRDRLSVPARLRIT